MRAGLKPKTFKIAAVKLKFLSHTMELTKKSMAYIFNKTLELHIEYI